MAKTLDDALLRLEAKSAKQIAKAQADVEAANLVLAALTAQQAYVRQSLVEYYAAVANKSTIDAVVAGGEPVI